MITILYFLPLRLEEVSQNQGKAATGIFYSCSMNDSTFIIQKCVTGMKVSKVT